MLAKNLICVTGLPRAGSTLLCQLLGLHPQIYSPGHSSPLIEAIRKMRHDISDSPFLAAQMDLDPDAVHQRLLNAFRGFVDGWFAEAEEPWVVDKNRSWLRTLELAHLLDPGVKMIVCIRDLGQVFGSIEAQHRKTLLFEFPDHLDPDTPLARANRVYGDGGIVGWPLRSMENLQDIPGAKARDSLYYIAFEKLLQDPVDAMNKICAWLGLDPVDWDPQDIPVSPGESDSHYHFKYRHRTYSSIRPLEPHHIPPRIEDSLKQKFRWYYQRFYPHLLPKPGGGSAPPPKGGGGQTPEGNTE